MTYLQEAESMSQFPLTSCVSKYIHIMAIVSQPVSVLDKQWLHSPTLIIMPTVCSFTCDFANIQGFPQLMKSWYNLEGKVVFDLPSTIHDINFGHCQCKYAIVGNGDVQC